MAGTKELGLADLFSESNVKMHSSTIYKALRGDGMRVRPLARTRSAIGKSQTTQGKSESRPGSYKPEKGRVAAIKNMFELKTTSSGNDPARQSSKEASVPSKSHSQSARSKNHPLRSNSPAKKLSAFIRRELTPLSESSTQRVPFRSTKLERPVSRASLKEDESEKKPKTLRRTIDTRALQKKSVPLFEVFPKGKGGFNDEKAKILSNLGQTRFGNKKRFPKRKRLGVTRRATVVAGKPVVLRNELPVFPRKEESKKTEAGSKPQKVGDSGGAAFKTRTKPRLTPTASLMEIPRVPSVPKTPASKKTTRRNSIIREVLPKTRVKSPVQPVRKKLWLPTETRDSYNQFCPDTKAKRTTFRKRKPQQDLKKKTNEENETDGRERKSGTAHTLAKSKFDNTSEEESSETDEEEARMIEEMRKQNELRKKSLEFFNQFRYGEMLRKSMPQIRYTSEILAKSEAEVKRRMTEMEVTMRWYSQQNEALEFRALHQNVLSRLNESVSTINAFIPKWTSMLQATKDVGKIEKIEKTLTNADTILNGKVEKALKMLEKYLTLIKNDGHSPPTEEMENIETHSELVQLDMDSLERVFESYERQLQQELDEPTSISL